MLPSRLHELLTREITVRPLALQIAEDYDLLSLDGDDLLAWCRDLAMHTSSALTRSYVDTPALWYDMFKGQALRDAWEQLVDCVDVPQRAYIRDALAWQHYPLDRDSLAYIVVTYAVSDVFSEVINAIDERMQFHVHA